MKGDELVVDQLDPILENAVAVISTGVGLFDEVDLSPQVVLPTPVVEGSEDSDAEAISDTLANPLMDEIVETCISVAAIFDKEKPAPKVVPPLPPDAIFSTAKSEEE